MTTLQYNTSFRTVPSKHMLLALAWCPCQPGKSTMWSISFISSVNENIPLMFPPLPNLAQMQINPFNTSPSAWMELGGCDKWKIFISFLISQSPKAGPLPRVPWSGIHEKAKDSSDAWSCYHLHCLNWKPYFLSPHLKSFSPCPLRILLLSKPAE